VSSLGYIQVTEGEKLETSADYVVSGDDEHWRSVFFLVKCFLIYFEGQFFHS